MSSCFLYTQKRGEVSAEKLEKGINFFIYGFMSMMAFILLQLVAEYVYNCYQKKGKKRGKVAKIGDKLHS